MFEKKFKSKDNLYENAMLFSFGNLKNINYALQFSAHVDATSNNPANTPPPNTPANATIGNATGAAILVDIKTNKIVWKINKIFPNKISKSAAEYEALILGLELLPPEIDGIQIENDNSTTMRQLAGIFEIKNAHLKKLYEDVLDILFEKEGLSFSFKHVLAENNTKAIELARGNYNALPCVAPPPCMAAPQCIKFPKYFIKPGFRCNEEKKLIEVI